MEGSEGDHRWRGNVWRHEQQRKTKGKRKRGEKTDKTARCGGEETRRWEGQVKRQEHNKSSCFLFCIYHQESIFEKPLYFCSFPQIQSCQSFLLVLSLYVLQYSTLYHFSLTLFLHYDMKLSCLLSRDWCLQTAADPLAVCLISPGSI